LFLFYFNPTIDSSFCLISCLISGVAAMDVPTRGANAESVILTENGEVEAGNAV
jgi:hypothetical protein